jgi:hypothetical protein
VVNALFTLVLLTLAMLMYGTMRRPEAAAA